MRRERHEDSYFNLEGKQYYKSGWKTSWLKEFSIEPKIIFQVGAQDLGDAIFMKQNFPEAIVYSFEASPTLYNQIEDDAKKYNIILKNIAITDVSGEIEFHEGTKDKIYTGNGSILKRTKKYLETFPFFEYPEPIKVKSISISDFCLDNNILNVDFLHMDIEGAELIALQGLGNILPKSIFVEKCYGEDYYVGGYNYGNMIQFLDNKGYELKVETEIDAFFVKK